MDLLPWLGSLVGSWPGAVLLQRSGTAYLFVNASHILGLAIMIGGILPMDLRLLGLFRSVPIAALGRILPRMAGVGLALALLSGTWLFTVKPVEYAANPALLWKLAILALALINVALQHRNPRFAAALRGEPLDASVRLSAAASIALWLGVLLAGRWIGFV